MSPDLAMLHAVEFSEFAVSRYGVPRRVTLSVISSFPEDLKKYLAKLSVFLAGKWYHTISTQTIDDTQLLLDVDDTQLLFEQMRNSEWKLWESKSKEQELTWPEDS